MGRWGKEINKKKKKGDRFSIKSVSVLHKDCPKIPIRLYKMLSTGNIKCKFHQRKIKYYFLLILFRRQPERILIFMAEKKTFPLFFFLSHLIPSKN